MPPTNEEPQVNNVWAQSAAKDVVESLTLPSGQVCKAKRIGLEGMMEAGLLGEADSLSAFIDKKHIQRVKDAKGNKVKEEISSESMMRDPKALQRIMLLVDCALPSIVVEPVVYSHVEILEPSSDPSALPKTVRIEMDMRVPGGIYTDQIGLEDKMFLFNFAVGGTRDLERFRSESGAPVAGVEHGEGVPNTPKRPPRRRRR